jgi:cysteine desulfurase
MRVYLDNAATTQIDPEVLQEMLPYLENYYGNPSSTHGHGREVKAAIEKSRKKVASLLNAHPSEIIFTSGGTESDNTVLRSCLQSKDIKHIVTSKVEHHAVLHTVEELESKELVKVTYLDFDTKGNVDIAQLESVLANSKNTLVSLMHGNNEIGNILDIHKVSRLCRTYGALFHSDTVQTVGHFNIDLASLDIDFLAASAHKFHGPKGVGFLYINKNSKIRPMLTGGGQEREMRGGTENVYGIIGLAKALELSLANLNNHKAHIEGLKSQMIETLKQKIEGVSFNGCSADLSNSLYTVLNVSLPASPANGMLLFSLDLAGISVSGGSACSSGAQAGSHVISALNKGEMNDRGTVRFSFSKFNTIEDINYTCNKLGEILSEVKVGH